MQVVRQHLPSQQLALRFNIDATKRGNAARFINHRCGDPNTTLVIVWRSGSLLPVVAVVARVNIKMGEEITFSYGDGLSVDDVPETASGQAPGHCKPKGDACTSQPCLCGSSYCKGFMPIRVPKALQS